MKLLSLITKIVAVISFIIGFIFFFAGEKPFLMVMIASIYIYYDTVKTDRINYD
jgi:hypothetical protein